MTHDVAIRQPDGCFAFWRKHTHVERGLHALVRQLTSVASLVMPELFTHPATPTWPGFVDVIMNRSLNWKMFGGQWILSWPMYGRMMAAYFGLATTKCVWSVVDVATGAGDGL